MIPITVAAVSEYMRQDTVSEWLNEDYCPESEKLVCQQWLRQSQAKRLVYYQMYGDLLTSKLRYRVLDIGGGITSLTPKLARNHDYILLDFLEHASKSHANKLQDELGRRFIFETDWSDFTIQGFDFVLANDIFPNVDQRLELFLQTIASSSQTLRLLVTCRENYHFYRSKRLNRNELLTQLSWNKVQTQKVIEQFRSLIPHFDDLLWSSTWDSPYDDGRQACLIQMSPAIFPSPRAVEL